VRSLSRHLSYANVMATIAVFVALGGASYAAIKLPANSVGTRQLRSGAVTLKKINRSTRASLRGARGAVGPKGAPGAQGPKGDAGPRGDTGAPAFMNRTRLHWSIGTPTTSAADFTLERTVGTVTKQQDGTILRVTVQDSVTVTGTGSCELQARIDGANDQGSTEATTTAGSTGTEATVAGTNVTAPMTIVAVFGNLPAGSHTLQLYLANVGGNATSCIENGAGAGHIGFIEETV